MSTFAESFAISLNLMKSCMGAGICAYPHVFNLYGVVLTVSLTVFSCIASVLGTYAYIDLNKRFGKNNTISTLGATVISPKFKYFVDLVIVLKCLAVAAGYLNMAKNFIETIFPKIGDRFSSIITPSMAGFLFTGIGCLILTSSILGQEIGKLKNLSYVGTLSILIIILLSFLEIQGKSKNIEFLPSIKTSILENIGIFVFGFSCHQSIITIHNESQIKERTLKMLILFSFLIVAILYLVFGLINYSAFSVINGIPQNLKDIFIHWNKDHLITKIAMILFASSLVLSVPFQLHPAKSYLISMLEVKTKDGYIVGILMMALCYFLTTQSWYNLYFVSNNVAKPLNSFICFGFPAFFTLFNGFSKHVFDYLICGYLVVFTSLCFLGYLV